MRRHVTIGVLDNVTGNCVQGDPVPEYRTTEQPCVVCLTTMSLDDERPKMGTVRWRVDPYFGLKRGKAVGFRCRQGHSDESDADLLRAFPSRTF
jgi:hypothetical protein